MKGENEQPQDLEDQQIWTLLDDLTVPDPDPNMEMRFQGMLEHYRHKESDKMNNWSLFRPNLKQFFSFRPDAQLVYSLILIVFGMGVGYYLSQRQSGTSADEKLSALVSQVADMRKMIVVSLLENPSATERLRAVNYTDEMQRIDRPIISALFVTLNGDPNVNVRLATLDALAKFSDQPEVREELVNSIVQQNSPMVQVAMANLMLKLQERNSITPFKELLKQQELDNAVRMKIKITIHKLVI